MSGSSGLRSAKRKSRSSLSSDGVRTFFPAAAVGRAGALPAVRPIDDTDNNTGRPEPVTAHVGEATAGSAAGANTGAGQDAGGMDDAGIEQEDEKRGAKSRKLSAGRPARRIVKERRRAAMPELSVVEIKSMIDPMRGAGRVTKRNMYDFLRFGIGSMDAAAVRKRVMNCGYFVTPAFECKMVDALAMRLANSNLTFAQLCRAMPRSWKISGAFGAKMAFYVRPGSFPEVTRTSKIRKQISNVLSNFPGTDVGLYGGLDARDVQLLIAGMSSQQLADHGVKMLFEPALAFVTHPALGPDTIDVWDDDAFAALLARAESDGNGLDITGSEMLSISLHDGTLSHETAATLDSIRGGLWGASRTQVLQCLARQYHFRETLRDKISAQPALGPSELKTLVASYLLYSLTHEPTLFAGLTH
jgi:hypothetical protein